MRTLLWPKSTEDEQIREVSDIFDGTRSKISPTTIFIAENDDGVLAGFLEVDLRSHADGCDPSRPAGFVEGWFVHETFRGTGVGRQLMLAAEDWAREQGCREMASDTWIDNPRSQCAHEALGFEVVDRCVHYRKSL
jgi:aminoglycoside 6'-N-acetyltransferase I